MPPLRCVCGNTLFTVDLPDGTDPKTEDWVTCQLGEEGLMICSKCGRSPMDAITETD